MAKAAKKPALSYKELSEELQETLTALQQETIDVDTAMMYYRRGLELVQQLKTYLDTTENEIVKLQAKYSDQVV